STVCPRLPSLRLRRSERVHRRAACFQLGAAAQTSPRFDRVLDSLAPLARALFLHLPNCVPAHGRAHAATGAGHIDFTRRSGIACSVALGGGGRSRPYHHDAATLRDKISCLTTGSASPFLRQSSADLENTPPSNARSQHSK